MPSLAIWAYLLTSLRHRIRTQRSARDCSAGDALISRDHHNANDVFCLTLNGSTVQPQQQQPGGFQDEDERPSAGGPSSQGKLWGRNGCGGGARVVYDAALNEWIIANNWLLTVLGGRLSVVATWSMPLVSELNEQCAAAATECDARRTFTRSRTSIDISKATTYERIVLISHRISSTACAIFINPSLNVTPSVFYT